MVKNTRMYLICFIATQAVKEVEQVTVDIEFDSGDLL